MKKLLHLLFIVLIFLKSFQESECKISRKLTFNKNLKSLKSSKYADLCAQFNYFPQYVDHFNFNPKNGYAKYPQRYIISDLYFRGNDNPIFFYTGNEGDIQWFCENTGFVWEIASKFGALVVFAEHRYYGTSLPFGNQSFTSPNIDYLTSEQALADYSYLISYLKSNIKGALNSPVIAFGGSYGGMLSAWFRMKYPNVVAGAIAASAPIYQFVSDCDTFSAVTTSAFQKADPKCPGLILASWDAINQVGKTPDGLKTLTQIFKLCAPLTNVDDLKAWLNDAYGNVAMANYPYPANFLNSLPAWPVKVMCGNITNSVKDASDPIQLLTGIYRAMNVFQNYSGDAKCLDIGSETPFDASLVSWGYQVCTEFVFPMCSNGINDMFEPAKWNYDDYAADCKSQYNIVPKPEWPTFYYGSSDNDIKSYSNILFSNGELDPWSGGGVLKNLTSKLPAILIQYGAHHLDLRGSNPNDPASVILARLTEIDYIQKWIADWSRV